MKKKKKYNVKIHYSGDIWLSVTAEDSIKADEIAQTEFAKLSGADILANIDEFYTEDLTLVRETE